MQDLGNKKILARNMKRLMEKKKVTAKQLSVDIEVPYTTILSWLKADNYPRIDKIDAMATYFGVLKSELIESKLTPEIEKDNDTIVGIIVELRSDKAFLSLIDSLRTDKEFLSLVESLHRMAPEKRNAIRGMLEALL